MLQQSIHSQLPQTEKLRSIRDICVSLNQELLNQQLDNQDLKENEKQIGDIVAYFAQQNGLQTRTVQPLVWSFSVEDSRLFDDGVIELVINDNNKLMFGYTEVSNSKITKPPKKDAVNHASEQYEIVNLDVHQAWIKKLGYQLSGWKSELNKLQHAQTTELEIKLNSLESLLDTIKNDSKQLTKETVAELERQWNLLYESLAKYKNKIINETR